ncbi:tetratricopeptide repeat protein [Flavobacteriaceae bacterium D16]|nr:tetratricopeptide repeat protein [Flavobacteriaceae bacterium D16]
MKTTITLFLSMLLLPLGVFSQKAESQYIEWRGSDTIANAMVWRGIDHLMNVEREKAYTFFEAAVAQDPSLFAPHVVLANFSWGDKRKHHVEQAKKNVEGKNEVSKLYVSLLDIDWQESDAADKRSAIWAKMYELAYDGKFVHFRYAASRKDVKDQIMELEKLAGILEQDGSNNGHVHNMLGYMQYAEGNKDKAKAHLEKYMELRPDSYNAYDSMGEYYFNEGDMENALAYYKKARMHYPASVGATDKIKEIEEKMGTKKE